jgi:hypothetical protein
MAVRNVLAGIRRTPGNSSSGERSRRARRAADLERQRWRTVWDVHVELSCRLPLAALDEVGHYSDAYLLDDTEAVVNAVARFTAASPTPPLRAAAELAQVALQPLNALRPPRPADETVYRQGWEKRAEFMVVLETAVPKLQALNEQLRAYVGSDVILPKLSWHSSPPR